MSSLTQSVTLSDGAQDSAQENQPAVQDVGEVQSVGNLSLSRRQLITDQESDEEANQLPQFAVNEEEADHQAQCFNLKSGVLMRKWQPRDAPADEEWQVVHQIVVPRKY